MYGAALGDIIGEPYEFAGNAKIKTFPLFSAHPAFTDDTVMTAAVADAMVKARDKDDDKAHKLIAKSLHKWGSRYPDAGYGGAFWTWLNTGSMKPYNSYGNGSAMRASAAGWLARTLPEAMRLGRLSAEVTHDHPEGIKGARAVSTSIYLVRESRQKGLSPEESKNRVREFCEREFGYDLSVPCNIIRPQYSYDVSCQGTVPPAITAFLESTDFEDAVRTAVSLGGDSDTLACITGSIAEALYGVPDALRDRCREIITKDIDEAFQDAYRASGEA